jgi:S-formylglutathione hydrolase FrmB
MLAGGVAAAVAVPAALVVVLHATGAKPTVQVPSQAGAGQGAATSSPSDAPDPAESSSPSSDNGDGGGGGEGSNPLPLLNDGPSPADSAPDSGGGGHGGGGGGSTHQTRYLPATDGARITAVRWLARREFDFTVASPALGSAQKVRVLVPKSWTADARRTWPIVYALHGGNDTYVSWTRSTDIAKVAAPYDVMVAMPEGSNGSYTNWYNGGRGGRPEWETFHVQEVRELLELNFHAGTSRAAMGISSGAGGAMTYAGRYPGLFKYVAAYSGVLDMLAPGMPQMLLYLNMRPGVDPEDIWGDPFLNYSNWAAHDPTTLLPRLRGTQMYVSSGNGQQGPLDGSARMAPWSAGLFSETMVDSVTHDFVDRAHQLGIPVTADFYGNGSHSWPYWQREMHRDWAAIMRAIGAGRS